MFLRTFRLSAVALLSAAVVAGCGSSSSSTPTTQQGRGPLGDSKVRACLQKQGVSLPRVPGGAAGRPPGGPGTTGAPPAGARPPRAGGPAGNPAQFQKLREAMQKCGVQLGSPGQGGPEGGPPPGQGAPGPDQGTAAPSR